MRRDDGRRTGHYDDPDPIRGYQYPDCHDPDRAAGDRRAYGQADSEADNSADATTHSSPDGPSDPSSDPSSDPETRQSVRSAAEPLELQLLRRRVDLLGAVELLQLLRLHPIVLGINQRLRRAVYRRHLLALGRTSRRVLISRRGATTAIRLMGFVRLGGCVALCAVMVLACGPSDNQSYNDGYEWGMANTVGVLVKQAPSCSQVQMVTQPPVKPADPNFLTQENTPEGAGEPSDDFAQWSAGCRAGAQQTIQNFNSP